MEVAYQPSWLTWVASVTSCLQALGVACDHADVAGYSGYAFHLAVSPDLCPSGPTMLNWERLGGVARELGCSTQTHLSTDCHTPTHQSDMTRAQCRAAFELARREIEAGRPCVIWGAYVPEFAVCVGIEGESYLVESFRRHLGMEQPPVPFDELDAPGGPYTLAFPTPKMEQPEDDALTIMAGFTAMRNALDFSRGTTWSHAHRFGVAGIDLWMEALERRKALRFGHGYNAACYAEARRYAHTFVGRLAERLAPLAEPLQKSAAAYARCAEALGRVSDLFPFRGPEEGLVDDAERIDQAVESLKLARSAELEALGSLEEAASFRGPRFA
jgi:hypothetical protein